MLGYSDQEFQRLTYKDLTPAKWLSIEEKIVREQVIPRGYSEIYQKEYRRKDGSVFPVELRTLLVRDNRGQPLSMWAIVRDITARKQAEAALRESELRHRALFEQAADSIVVFDPETLAIEDFNEEACRRLGYTHEEFSKLRIFDLDVIETAADTRNQCKRIQVEKLRLFDTKHRTKSGKVLDIEVRAKPIQVGEKNLIQAIWLDVTARKQAEMALRESEQRFRLATEATGVGVWEWNVRTNQIRWDLPMFRLYGMAPTEDGSMHYSDWSGAVLPEDLPKQEAILQDMVLHGGQSFREFRIRRRNDGECRNLQAVEAVRKNALGQVEWVVGTNLDVTEIKNSRRELEYLASFPENSPNPILEVDLNGRMCYENSAARISFPDLAAQGADHPFLAGLGALVESFEKDKKRLLARSIKVHDLWFDQTLHYLGDSNRIRIYGADITKRKLAELALKENQARLRRVLFGSNDGFWDWNVAEDKFFVSARWWQIAGLRGSVRDLCRDDMEHLIHPEDRAKVQSILGPVIEGRAGGDHYHLECRYRRPDGSIVWVDSRGTVIDRDASGRAKQISGATTDITARRDAEDALRASEARYRRLFETTRDGILILHAETGAVVDVNPFMIEKLGISRELLLGKKIWELGFFKHVVASQSKFRELQEKEYIRYDDLPLQTAGGRQIDVEFISNVYQVGDHKVIQCNVRDITDRKRAERELRDSQTRYRHLVLCSPEAIVVHQGGKIVFANPAALKMFAAGDKKELLGKPVLWLIAKADRIIAKNRLRQTMSEEVPKAEIGFARLDGTLFDGEVTGQGVLYNEKAAVEFVIRDISDRKKVEEILLRDREMLKKLVDDKAHALLEVQKEVERAKRLSDIGVLAATVAHELRTPLGVIRIAAYNMGRKVPGPLLKKNLENIEKKVLEANQIINNLLFYSRVRKVSPEKVRVHDLLEECVQTVNDRFRQRGVQLERKYNSVRNVWAILDPLQIKEVISNMLINAFEALPAGKGRVKVTAHCDAPNKEFSIAFEDNGVGIRAEDLDKVKEPFFSTKSKGTGLGLTVCYQIVKNHKGRIDVTSQAGKGTVFTVVLPCAVREGT